jgi:hypothetical protein
MYPLHETRTGYRKPNPDNDDSTGNRSAPRTDGLAHNLQIIGKRSKALHLTEGR